MNPKVKLFIQMGGKVLLQCRLTAAQNIPVAVCHDMKTDIWLHVTHMFFGQWGWSYVMYMGTPLRAGQYVICNFLRERSPLLGVRPVFLLPAGSLHTNVVPQNSFSPCIWYPSNSGEIPGMIYPLSCRSTTCLSSICASLRCLKLA